MKKVYVSISLVTNETNRLVIKHLQLYQDFLIKFNFKHKNKNLYIAICGAMSVSFFWPPVFRSMLADVLEILPNLF